MSARDAKKFPHGRGGEPLLIEQVDADAVSIPTSVGEATARHGGRREGAGRKPVDPNGPGVDRAFRLFPRQLEMIARWQAKHQVNASEAVRQMIERASPLDR